MATKLVVETHSPRVATLTVKAPNTHIYPFSRLVAAPAGKWEKLISELEEKQKIIYLYYQPVREAIVKLAAKGGQDREKIFAEMSQRAAAVTHLPSQNPVRDNQQCFACFEEKFLPKIETFKTSLLRNAQPDGTFFGGIILRGLPHMIVTDKRGRDRYVYLYPSSWKENELDAYMELLTIVIETEFGAAASDLWCMGLRTGLTIPRPKSKSRTRQSCRDAAKLFRRLVDSGHIVS